MVTQLLRTSSPVPLGWRVETLTLPTLTEWKLVGVAISFHPMLWTPLSAVGWHREMASIRNPRLSSPPAVSAFVEPLAQLEEGRESRSSRTLPTDPTWSPLVRNFLMRLARLATPKVLIEPPDEPPVNSAPHPIQLQISPPQGCWLGPNLLLLMLEWS